MLALRCVWRVHTGDMHIKTTNAVTRILLLSITFGVSLFSRQRIRKRKQERISGIRAHSLPAHGLHVHAFAPQDVILQIDNATIA